MRILLAKRRHFCDFEGLFEGEGVVLRLRIVYNETASSKSPAEEPVTVIASSPAPSPLLSLCHRMFKSSDNQPHHRQAREKVLASGWPMRFCLQAILPVC